ncbi:MAG: sigma-70 family RNA polymerase sigma factor [Janthinobacterium lividum]
MPLLVPLFHATVGGRAPTRSSDPAQRQALAELTLERLRAARDADPATRRALVDDVVVSHLWLADSVARRFRDRGEDAEDLRQIARAGLVEACGRFDPDQGSFAAFAFPTVTGLVKRHFRDHGWSVRPSRPTQELSAEMWRRWPEVAQAVGGEPTERQLAEVLQVPLDDVRRARRATQAYSCSSLDALTPDHESSDPDSERCDARVLVSSAWKGLTGAEQSLLTMRFFEERSQSDIAVALGTNQMQVSRLLARVLKKLRASIGSLDEPRAA